MSGGTITITKTRTMSTKYGVMAVNETEWNVLQVALTHMLEHLESIKDEEDVTDRLKACKNLIKAHK